MLNTTQCYLRCGGEVLLQHRTKKEGDCNRDKWIAVGGKFEPGESPEDCMLREVWEETGLRLDAWRYRGIVTFVSDVWEAEFVHLFTAECPRIEPPDCREGELAWLPWSRLPELPIWEGDRIFLRLIDEERPFFSLKLRYRGDELVQAVLDGKPLRLPGFRLSE
ncbi:MAG: 8-oxo-dGTP diphosphatase [Oscillospiraceae bacterium]|nr:8-oxo-dGTP diphosphatase [Oscillospiraceae bacterium]